jgi:hypothetical protein
VSRGPVNHTICPVFNEEKARTLLVARGRTPITRLSWRRLDGNVHIVTELLLADLSVGAHSTDVFGLSVVPVGRVLGGLSVQVTGAAKKVLRLVPIDRHQREVVVPNS